MERKSEGLKNEENEEYNKKNNNLKERKRTGCSQAAPLKRGLHCATKTISMTFYDVL